MHTKPKIGLVCISAYILIRQASQSESHALHPILSCMHKALCSAILWLLGTHLLRFPQTSLSALDIGVLQNKVDFSRSSCVPKMIQLCIIRVCNRAPMVSSSGMALLKRTFRVVVVCLKYLSV